jgi:hypothetical protein
MRTIFWIGNQEFEMIIDKQSKTWVLFNYTLQTIVKEGSLNEMLSM